jgi:hypothetical protein
VLALLVARSVPGPHHAPLMHLEHTVMYTIWWFGLGVASSVGLMEATKRAGALDLQGGQYKRSALHWASAKGLAGTVAQLLALGADATLKDKVYRYRYGNRFRHRYRYRNRYLNRSMEV